MSPPNYLLDENVDPVYASELIRRDPVLIVWRIGTPGAPPKGTSDPDLLIWCEAHAFVLVTNNRKSVPAHLQKTIWPAGGMSPASSYSIQSCR